MKDLVLSSKAACVLLTNGSVVCAGENYYAQLGADTQTRSIYQFTHATALAALNVSSVGLGWDFMCVLAMASSSASSSVYCLGANYAGQLGNGNKQDSKIPVSVRGPQQSAPIAQLAVDYTNACVLYSEPGSVSFVKCWGVGTSVQTEQGLIPQAIDIPGVNGAVSIALGTHGNACALLNTGTVARWYMPDTAAVSVPGLSSVVRVAAAQQYQCAIVRSASEPDSLWCWGQDYYGAVSNSSAPWKVSGLPGNVTDVALGVSHACALVDTSGDDSGGAVFCWGANNFGQLGQGYSNVTTKDTERPVVFAMPVFVKGLGKVRALYGGVDNACAALASGQVLCWGYNAFQQLPVGDDKQVFVERLTGVRVVPTPAPLLHVCTP
jgi:alpha-tubulin suppressor-like RCC1 family protein